MYIVSCIQNKINMKLQQKHCNQTHHSSVIIIIIITVSANHCSLFTVQHLSEFYFSPIKYAVPIPITTIPIPIPISIPELLPCPWVSHGNPMGMGIPMGIPIPMHTSNLKLTRMWANDQRDGRPAEHRWSPLFNAAKFG